MVEEDIRKLKVKSQERTTYGKPIKEMEKKKQMIIRPADKGGGLVILHKIDYKN